MASFSTTYMIKDEKTRPRKPMYIVVMSSYNKMVEHYIILSFYNWYFNSFENVCGAVPVDVRKPLILEVSMFLLFDPFEPYVIFERSEGLEMLKRQIQFDHSGCSEQ